jgi:hypothetical protein
VTEVVVNGLEVSPTSAKGHPVSDHSGGAPPGEGKACHALRRRRRREGLSGRGSAFPLPLKADRPRRTERRTRRALQGELPPPREVVS